MTVKGAFFIHFASITLRDVLLLILCSVSPPSTCLNHMLQQAGACCPPEVLFIVITGEEHERDMREGHADVFKMITKTAGVISPRIISIYASCISHPDMIFSMFRLHLDTSLILDRAKLWLCVDRAVQQTYECLFFIFCPKPVASWEEGVRICCIKPLKVTQIHTEPHLNETKSTSR